MMIADQYTCQTTERPQGVHYLHGAPSLLYELLGSGLIRADDWEQVGDCDRERLVRQHDQERLLSVLVDLRLITPYQATRIATGNLFGLVLGNFRILERLGAGGMAVVYKAEHIEMGHTVAIKVLQLHRNDDPRLELRFSAEMRAIARLRHPNIVAAMDAGRAYSHDPDSPVLWYLVMEYLPGEDLHTIVSARGPLPMIRACNLIHQIAGALAETHKLHLVHRDIKPANILVTPEDHAKLLDFGLSRYVPAKLTQPGTVLGTIDYMAPEQARDASSVDVRADIYCLGGTLFWCLTGHPPFPPHGNDLEVLLRRLNQKPPSLRAFQPGLPQALDSVLRKMMACDPTARYETPREVMQALLPFLKPAHPAALSRVHATNGPEEEEPAQRILLIDDDSGIQKFCQEVLGIDRYPLLLAPDGETGLRMLAEQKPDLVLCDVYLPNMTGSEVLRRIRSNPPIRHLKVIMISGQALPDEMAGMMLSGADDYMSKPFSLCQLLARVKAVLRLKAAQDRADRLQQQLDSQTEERRPQADLSQLRSSLVMALAQLVQLRESDSSRHAERMPRYCRCLAEAATKREPFGREITESFIDHLVSCAPLHDIGKAALPDHILLAPGRLGADERTLMQTHTSLGADVLSRWICDPSSESSESLFMQMACDVVRHHHERFDGTGYPNRLAGSAIPLAARLVAIADVYDALRSRRSYKPPLSHEAAARVMLSSQGQFDPGLLEVFAECAQEFERIFREVPG